MSLHVSMFCLESQSCILPSALVCLRVNVTLCISCTSRPISVLSVHVSHLSGALRIDSIYLHCFYLPSAPLYQVLVVLSGICGPIWFSPSWFSPTVYACGRRPFRFGRDRTVAESAIGPSSTTKTINSVDLLLVFGTSTLFLSLRLLRLLLCLLKLAPHLLTGGPVTLSTLARRSLKRSE